MEPKRQKRRLLIPAALCSLLVTGGCAGSKPAGNGYLTDLGNGICQERGNGRMWQLGRGGPVDSWQEARDYAAGLELGGFTDWRLPTRKELYTLHAIFDLQKNGDCRLDRKGDYFSGVNSNEASAGAWQTYSLCGGNEYEYVKGDRGFVRAVRP